MHYKSTQNPKWQAGDLCRDGTTPLLAIPSGPPNKYQKNNKKYFEKNRKYLVTRPGADERSRDANRPTLPPSEVDVRIRFFAGGLGSAV